MERTLTAETKMPRPNLIFLDFDGVLNDPYWLIQTWPLRKRHYIKFEFDWYRLEILARICDRTDAKLVLSSSWNSRKGVKEYFESMGFEVVGRLGAHLDRGAAIKEWFNKHPEYGTANYAILDDEKSGYDEEQLKHLVFTGTYAIYGWAEDNIHLAPRHIGLNTHNIEEALRLLEVKNEQPLSKSKTAGSRNQIPQNGCLQIGE